jgi:hypothetical protein
VRALRAAQVSRSVRASAEPLVVATGAVGRHVLPSQLRVVVEDAAVQEDRVACRVLCAALAAARAETILPSQCAHSAGVSFGLG